MKSVGNRLDRAAALVLGGLIIPVQVMLVVVFRLLRDGDVWGHPKVDMKVNGGTEVRSLVEVRKAEADETVSRCVRGDWCPIPVVYYGQARVDASRALDRVCNRALGQVYHCDPVTSRHSRATSLITSHTAPLIALDCGFVFLFGSVVPRKK